MDKVENEEENYMEQICNIERLALKENVTTCWNTIDVKVPVIRKGQQCLSCKEKCSGFKAHPWRKICVKCKCPCEDHDFSAPSRVSTSKEYSWIPPGLATSKIGEYFNQLPNNKVPRVGSPGEKYREKQLVVQLPKQDLALSHCKYVEDHHSSSFTDFINLRNEMALDLGIVKENDSLSECENCGGVLGVGEVMILAPKYDAKSRWHPACFICSKCDELLVDLIYCAFKSKLYCERHYAEESKPRCAACDELIYCGEYTKAMEKDWHIEHFCCWHCDDSLTGKQYVCNDGNPFCIKCYENMFSNICEGCKKYIGIDSKDLCYKDKHWHEDCFKCTKCQMTLVEKSFGYKNDSVFCGTCYDDTFSNKCSQCGHIFSAGTKKILYKEKEWHEKCFICCECKSAIGSKSFVPKGNYIYCNDCYEQSFGTRCVKCNKVINSNGITYKNEPWHRECFICSHCSTSLAGQRFALRDDRHYCVDCFGELFAKRCTACSRPITGVNGARFISFEDRHWHNDCFVCANCESSLVGKGFITDGADILCSDCAKMRLA